MSVQDRNRTRKTYSYFKVQPSSPLATTIAVDDHMTISGTGTSINLGVIVSTLSGSVLTVTSTTELRNTIGDVNRPATLNGASNGLFVWSNTPATDDDGTIFNVGGFGASSSGWRRVRSVALEASWFGTKADGQIATATINSGSSTFTCSGLTSADIGKLATFRGAGVNGATLCTTITNVVGTTITLALGASTTATNERFVWASNDTVALQRFFAALSSVATHTRTGSLPAGIYGHTGVVIPSGCRITGQASRNLNTLVGSTRLMYMSSGGDAYTFGDSVIGTHVEDMVLDGGTCAATVLACRYLLSDSSLERVVVCGAQPKTLLLAGGKVIEYREDIPSNSEIDNLVFRRCYVVQDPDDWTRYAAYLVYNTNTQAFNITYEHCILASADQLVWLSTGSCNFEHCQIFNWTSHAFLIAILAQPFTLLDCYTEGTDGTYLEIFPSAGVSSDATIRMIDCQINAQADIKTCCTQKLVLENLTTGGNVIVSPTNQPYGRQPVIGHRVAFNPGKGYTGSGQLTHVYDYDSTDANNQPQTRLQNVRHPYIGDNTLDANAAISVGTYWCPTLTADRTWVLPGGGFANSLVQGATGPAISLTGLGIGPYLRMRIKISTGGVLGVGKFDWSLDNGVTWEATGVTIPGGGSYVLGATGSTVVFSAGNYILNEEYAWSSELAIFGSTILISRIGGVDGFTLTVAGHNLRSGDWVHLEWDTSQGWRPMATSLSSPLDVRLFGVVGDGVTDDRIALNNAQGVGASLLIGSNLNVKIGSNLTLTVPLVFDTGKFSPSVGTTTIISGSITAPISASLFAGLGSIELAMGSTPHVYPDWFGDDVQKAVNVASPSGIPVLLRDRTYSLGTSTLKLLSDRTRISGITQTFLGATGGAKLTYTGVGHAIEVGDTLGTSFIRGVELKDFTLDCGSTATIGLFCWYSAGGHYEGLNVKTDAGNTSAGIQNQLGIDNLFERCFVQGNTTNVPGSPPYADRAILLKSLENTTTTYRECYFQYGSICADIDTDASRYDGCIFETSLRGYQALNFSVVDFMDCHWENVGSEIDGYEITGYIDQTSTVHMISPRMIMYKGQSTLFRMVGPGGTARLSVEGGRADGGWTQAITSASNATPIQITSVAHGLVTGQVAKIAGVGGDTAANGTWKITRIDADNFTLNTSVGNFDYTASGTLSAESRFFAHTSETNSIRASFDRLALSGQAATDGLWSVGPMGERNVQFETPDWTAAKFIDISVSTYHFAWPSVSATSSSIMTAGSAASTQYVMPADGYVLGSTTYYSAPIVGGTVAANVAVNGVDVLETGAFSAASLRLSRSVLSVPFVAGDVLAVTGSSTGLNPAGGVLSCDVLIGFGDAQN